MSLNLINKLCLFLIILLSIAAFSSFSKEKIVLAADKWCPYNCDPKSEMPGYIVEMAKIIFAKHNIEVEYVLRPWEQALKEAKEGKVNGVIGISFNENSELVYPEAPQAYGITAAYTTEDSNWRYENVNSLKDKKIGLILGYEYPDDIGNYIFIELPKSPELFVFETGEDAVQNHLNNLLNKKIDVYLENEYVMSNYIAGKSNVKIRHAGRVENSVDRMYIAFSPANKNSETYAKFLSEGMNELRNSGKLAELHKKYGLNHTQDFHDKF